MKAKHVFLRIRMMCIVLLAMLCTSCTVQLVPVAPQPFHQQRVIGVGAIGGIGFNGFNGIGGIGCRPPMIAPGGFHPQFGGWGGYGGQGGWNHPGFGMYQGRSFQHPYYFYPYPRRTP